MRMHLGSNTDLILEISIIVSAVDMDGLRNKDGNRFPLHTNMNLLVKETKSIY
jgi:hypothetical protein